MMVASDIVRFDMMFESFSAGIRRHGVFAAAVAGTAFPILVFIFEAGHGDVANAARMMLTDPLRAISFSVPFLATVLAGRMAEAARLREARP